MFLSERSYSNCNTVRLCSVLNMEETPRPISYGWTDTQKLHYAKPKDCRPHPGVTEHSWDTLSLPDTHTLAAHLAQPLVASVYLLSFVYTKSPPFQLPLPQSCRPNRLHKPDPIPGRQCNATRCCCCCHNRTTAKWKHKSLLLSILLRCLYPADPAFAKWKQSLNKTRRKASDGRPIGPQRRWWICFFAHFCIYTTPFGLYCWCCQYNVAVPNMRHRGLRDPEHSQSLAWSFENLSAAGQHNNAA